MNENWEPGRATAYDVQSNYPEEVEGEYFFAQNTAPDKDLEEGRAPTRPNLRIVRETSSAGYGTARYSSGKNLGFGVERERQRDGLRNELYAEVLTVQLGGLPNESGWEKPLDQILRVVEMVPGTALMGRVYVSEDGEIGIVWETGNVRIEVSAGVSEHVEYLVLDDDGVREESIWKIESEDSMPATLWSALEGRPCHGEA